MAATRETKQSFFHREMQVLASAPSPQHYWGADTVVFLPCNRAGQAEGRAPGPTAAVGCRCTNLTLFFYFMKLCMTGI